MATWQFDLHLIPRCKLQQVFGAIPDQLEKESFHATHWWQDVELPSGYRELLSAFVPFNASWCPDIELWGDIEGDRVEVCQDKGHEGQVDSIYVRVDVADLSPSFINGITSFAQACDCLLFTEDKQLIEPSPELLGKAISQSSAMRFVTNPPVD